MPDHTEIQDAFRALAATVAEMEGRGKSTRIAGVKPQVSRRLGGAFSERALGFESFHAFADAAVAAGFIEAGNDADGWFVLQAKSSSANSAAARGDQDGGRLRPDIWRAFTEWGDGWLRVWDRASARAVRLSKSAQLHEGPERADLRRALEAGSDGAILITPISQEVQLKWMREFVSEIGDHPLARPLEASLADPRPFRTVSLVLRSDPVLRHKLHTLRASKVLSAVREWAAIHSVDLDAIDDAPSVPAGVAPVLHPETDRSEIGRLRESLHKAIDQMPLEDLRQLHVPAGLLFDALR